ncbi:MAG TPA: hypothetical protein VJ927_04645 [Actinomycetota bacterium]|nr:hypothetical protein [Actinomycetota bacterium]
MRAGPANKITAVMAAGALAFSGASAFAATARGTDAKTSAAAQRCKKSKKAKKKCPPAETGFVPGRVVELTYEGPAIGGADTPAVNPFGLIAPVNFIPGAGEVLATIEIIDDHTPKASAGFSYDSDGDGLNDTTVDVCGSTPEPVEMLPGTQYNVFPYLLPSTSCTDGIATSGTIIVTFNKV